MAGDVLRRITGAIAQKPRNHLAGVRRRRDAHFVPEALLEGDERASHPPGSTEAR